VPSRVVVIANPTAGRGRAARLLPSLRENLGNVGVTDVRLTSAPGDEITLARDAAAEGAETIVAVGGDGTWGKVARGIIESGRSPRLAMVAAGTGNDFAHNSGVPSTDLDTVAPTALGSASRPVDAGRVEDVVFLNVTGFGFQVDVVRESSRSRWLRGHAVYLVTAGRLLLSYRGLNARLSQDDGSRRYLLLVIANGARFGGGFVIAPHARTDDGVLDLVVVRDASPLRRAALFAAVKRAAHLGAPEVATRQIRETQLSFESPPLFDADGDLYQAKSRDVRVQCLPGAVRLAMP
jgi:diacylglycerol kinase (ATP)